MKNMKNNQFDRTWRAQTSPSVPLTEVIPTDKVEVGFKDIDAAILVGSMPRKEGMERKDLLKANVAIFKTQGAALDKYAKKTVKVTPHTETVCLGRCRGSALCFTGSVGPKPLVFVLFEEVNWCWWSQEMKVLTWPFQ